jgi:hypothetical protein
MYLSYLSPSMPRTTWTDGLIRGLCVIWWVRGVYESSAGGCP